MPVEVVEALVPVVVAPAQLAHVEVRDKVVLAAVAVMQADKHSRVAAIVLPAQTTRRVVLSQTR